MERRRKKLGAKNSMHMTVLQFKQQHCRRLNGGNIMYKRWQFKQRYSFNCSAVVSTDIPNVPSFERRRLNLLQASVRRRMHRILSSPKS